MTRQLHTIFCDDIRHEVAGKLSLIGVYGAKLLVSEFPAVLPKLCLVATAVTPLSNPFEKLEIRVLRDDEVLAKGEALPKKLPEVEGWAIGEDAEDPVTPMLQVNAHFVFAPFEILGPCVLRVRAHTGNEVIRGPGLRIERAPSPDSASGA